MSKAQPSKRCSLADLQPGQQIEQQVFRIAQKDLRTTSNGSLYIHAVLADHSGQMLARMWNASQEIYASIPEGGLLELRGRVENYRGNRQFIIDGVRAVRPGSYDPSEFLPATGEDVEAMWAEVKVFLRTIENKDLLALVGKFINDEELVRGFKQAPAAVQMHHAFLGGLLEHTRNLLRLANAICPLYPQVSRDLVLTAVFLHDAGKVRELAYETNLEYSNEGQLIGHITQCTLWIHDACRALEQESGQPFPSDLEWLLEHIILAHHGRYEYGSPRLPATPEAFVVHYLDNLDAKLAMTLDAIASDPDADSDWTGYVRSIETRVCKLDPTGARTPHQQA